MANAFRFVLLAGVVVFIAGCDRRTEEVVVAPPPTVQPEPTYNKF